MFERFTWPLRKFAWWVEERVIWRISDSVRGRSSLPLPSSGAAPGHRTAARRIVLRLPSGDSRFGDVRVALATVAVAAGVGIGIAALAGGSGSPNGRAPSVPAPVSQVGSAAQISPPTASPAAGQASGTLSGAQPNFKAGSQAGAATSTPYSPTQDTNAKPSSIPASGPNDAAALGTARDFAGAFVLYEVGKSSAETRQTIARTTTPSVAKALRDRPPRLPAHVKVPQAKVQNVVLGARQGRTLSASVSLLRVGTLSELRLTLTQRHGTWLVSEVLG